ncbi:MAG TPA: hypothetical protein VKN16_26450 [Methylomirabilota bacterium]|nr:hypothetical protein [Methylomirabilota bacterium]
MSTRRDWGNIFRIAAAAGFAASAALHLATFTPLPPAVGAASAVTLFLGALGLLAAMIVRLRAAGAPLRGQGTVRVVDWRRLAAFVPEGTRRATLAVVAYVLMNFVLCLVFLDESAGSVRLLSGHLLLFYLIPLLYFRFVEPRLRDGGDRSDP